MKVFLAVLATMIAVTAFAVVPPTMTYQGIFMDAEGNVMPDGDYVVGFHIFGGPGGGPPDWTEYDTIHVENGLFEVVLGQSVPMNPAFIRPTGTWLGLTYNQQFLEPRQPMNTVAYSFRTCWADSAFGAATLGIHTPASITANQDSVRACLDTLKQMSVERLFLERYDSDIEIGEDDETEFESATFTLNVPSIVNFWATVGEVTSAHESDYENYTRIIVWLYDTDLEEVVYETIATGAALPGSPSIYSARADLPAGTYKLIMELFCEDQAVAFQGYELGATYHAVGLAR
jgi:hypothetical protein